MLGRLHFRNVVQQPICRMRLLKNSGDDRVVDELSRCLVPRSTLDLASPAFSLFAFASLCEELHSLANCRLVLPASALFVLQLLGSEADRSFRNRLSVRWHAKKCAEWL